MGPWDFLTAIASIQQRRPIVLDKTAATGSLLIVATAGAPSTCSPALAEPVVVGRTQTHNEEK